MVCEGAFGFGLLARDTCRRDCPAAALHIKPVRPYSKRFELAQAGPSNRSRIVSFMVIFQIVVLALIQGITEFLPISSSGHLLLVPALTGWPDQGVLTDVMVHMGSFLAVVVYFWRDCVNLTLGALDMLRGRITPWGKLAMLIVIGTIPAVVFGVILDKIGFMEAVRQMPQIVAWNAIIFGVLLYLCDRFGLSIRRMSDMTLMPALIIGVAQAIAIIPGTSRSGITMTAARALGFERPEAARFAFLLGIPAIAGAGVFKLGDAAASGEAITFSMLLTAVLTFFVALGTITVLMKMVRHISFLPFAVYRVLLGLVLLALIYSGMPLGAVN
jgi:undecaprenyl-diphosphatase